MTATKKSPRWRPGLRCSECGSEAICAQNKAFVTQNIHLEDDGSIVYGDWGTEDVEFDGPEWYVCRDCGNHGEDIDTFKKMPLTDEEVRKLAFAKYDGDNIDIPVNAKVSRGSDPGAFVSAWVWVDFDEEKRDSGKVTT
jgi:hypothetical protein